MKKIKIITLALAALLLAGSLISCDELPLDNGGSNISDSVTPPQDSNSEAVPAEQSGISAYEWNHKDNEIMMTIDGTDIDFATYRYYAMNFKPQYDMGDEAYWNEETEAQFKNDMIEEIKKLIAIERLCADKKIVLSEDDINGISEYLEQFKAIYGEDVYNQQIDLAYLTKDVYVSTNTYNLYLEDLYIAAADAEKVKAYANDNYVHVKHVLIGTLDEEGKDYTGEKLEEKTKLANEIYERAKGGEDFDVLVKEYGEDPGMEATPEGYTFTYGMMVPEFEQKSFELSEGEISEPVKTSYGYHIIQKLPINFDALIDESNQTYWQIVSAIAAEPVQTEIAEKAKTFEVTTTDAFNELTITNIGIKK